MAELELPDGSSLEFPDDMDPQEAATRWKASQLVHQGQSNYLPEMASSTGKAFMEFARKAMNHLNINGAMDSTDPDQFGSTPNIKRAEAEDAPAFAKAPLAKLVTDMAVTAPIGGPVEGSIAKLGTSALAKTLSKIAGSAASGGITAGLNSDPGQVAEGTGVGSAIGGALSALGSVGGRFGRGLVQKSEELQRLEGDVARNNALPGAGKQDLFVPVSQGFDPDDLLSSAIGRFYRGGMSYIPGVSTQLENQSAKGAAAIRGSLLQQEAPNGFTVPTQGPKDMQLTTKQVADEYAEMENQLKQLPGIKIPDRVEEKIRNSILAQDSTIPFSHALDYASKINGILKDQAQNAKDGYINGWNLKNVRDQISDLQSSLPDAEKDGMTSGATKVIDDLFAQSYGKAFTQNNKKQMDILQNYHDAIEKKPAFSAIQDAVNAAKADNGNYPFSSLASKSPDLEGLQSSAQDANKLFSEPAAKISQEGRVAGYGLTGALAALGHIPALAVIAGGGNALASKGAQRALLYADTPLQKSMRALMEKYPKTADALGYGIRNTAAADAEQESN